LQSKQKGNIALSSVVLILQKSGFNVFSEIGDFSRIDLIAELNGIIKTMQVKFCKKLKGAVYLKREKSGPNGYRYTYSEKDVDWFAVYEPESEKIGFIKTNEVCENKQEIRLRVDKPKNNQRSGVRLIEDYSIERFLRDFTQNTCNGDDKVQTTTEMA